MKAVLIEQLKKAAGPPPAAPAQTTQKAGSGSRSSHIERCRKYLDKCEDAISGKKGHDKTFHAACECYRFGLSDAEALGVMQWFNETKTGGEPWPEKDLIHKLESAKTLVGSDFGSRLQNDANPGTAKQIQASVEPSDPILVPGNHIDASGQGYRINNDEFANHVLSQLPDGALYLRGGVPGELIGDNGERSFKQTTVDRMRLVVDANVRLWKWSAKKPERVFVACKADHSKLVIAAAPFSDGIKSINIITPYPIYTPGFKLAPPGWSDGVYYDQPKELEGLKPITRRDFIRTTLEDLLIDFPWKDEQSRQNFIGLLFTPFIRPAIKGNTPMHLIGASLERTGKTKLAEEVLGGIALGKHTPAMQMGNDDAEFDKRVLSKLIKGDTIIHLDNIRHHLDSATLASLLTASTYTGRILGVSQTVDLPNTLIVVGTGNNVTSSGEIAKRIVPIILQPATADPESRTDFEHSDLTEYVASVRLKVLSCLLGAVELWKEEGQPKGAKPLGGFEQWAATIGGIMGAIGYDKWLDNYRQWTRDADPQGEDLRTFAEAWHKQFGNEPVSPAQLIALASEIGVFPEVLRSQSEKGRLTAFGMRVLRKHVDTPVSQWILRREGSGSSSWYFLQDSIMTLEQENS